MLTTTMQMACMPFWLLLRIEVETVLRWKSRYSGAIQQRSMERYSPVLLNIDKYPHSIPLQSRMR
jgi:hypothetical protein